MSDWVTYYINRCDTVRDNYVCTVGSDRPVLRDVVNQVIPLVANHWYNLGLQLLEPKYENELNIIEADKDDIKTRCRKMFIKWLITDKLASWDKLTEALTLVGLDNATSHVKQLLGQSEFNSTVTRGWASFQR